MTWHTGLDESGDRRQSRRHPCRIDCDLISQGRPLGKLINVSLEGLMALVITPLPEGECLTLRLVPLRATGDLWPQRLGSHIQLVVECLWCEPLGEQYCAGLHCRFGSGVDVIAWTHWVQWLHPDTDFRAG